MTEAELLEAIEEAKAAEDWALVKSLMQDLIALQAGIEPPVQMTDEELAEVGVDMELLAEERRLRDAAKTAEQNGDFLEAQDLHRRLVQIQKLQIKWGGVTMYGH
jgi:hypothetical protein